MRNKKLTTTEKFDSTLLIRISKSIKDDMKKIAKKMGLNLSTLARMWLMEKVQSFK